MLFSGRVSPELTHCLQSKVDLTFGAEPLAEKPSASQPFHKRIRKGEHNGVIVGEALVRSQRVHGDETWRGWFSFAQRAAISERHLLPRSMQQVNALPHCLAVPSS